MEIKLYLFLYCLPPYARPDAVNAFSDSAVFIYPGLIHKTLTLCSATSARSESQNACNACFEAEYAERCGNENFPWILLTHTICPSLRFIILGSTAT